MRSLLLVLLATPLQAVSAPPRPPVEEVLTRAPLPAAAGVESIEGNVVSAQGPVAGASVFAVRTDAPDLVTRLPGNCPGPAHPAIALRCPVDERLLAEAVRKGIGAASVAARATSGADGSFRLVGLAPGEYALYAHAPGLVGLVTNVRSGPERVELELTTGIILGGGVLYEGERGAGTATISAFHADAPIFVKTRSKSDGSFRFGPLPGGRWFVVAERKGALPEATSQSEHDVPISGVSLGLGAPRRITGTVRANGRPAGGVRVVLPYIDDEEPIAVTTSDRNGRFVFDGLKPGVYAVTAADGPRAARADAVLWKKRRALVDLDLGTAAFIRGRIFGTDGAPIAGARVRAHAAAAVQTSGDGSFELGPFQPGTQDVQVSAAARQPGRAEVMIERGRDSELTLALVSAFTVSGQVTAGGAPVESARIARDDPEDPWGEMLAETDAAGRFAFDVRAPGPIPLKIEHPDHATWRATVTAPWSSVDVRLDTGLAISGTVLDETGRGIRARLRVSDSEGRELWVRRAETDRHGRFTLRGLPAAPVRLAAVTRAREWDEAGRTRRSLARSVSKVLDLRRGVPSDLLLRVGARASIVGRLAGLASGGEASVTLTALPYDWLTDHDDEDPDRHLFERDGAYGGGYLGPDGRFEFRGLPLGRYAVVISVTGARSDRGARRELTLESPGTIDLGEIRPAAREQ